MGGIEQPIGSDAALRASEQRFHALLESASVAIVMVDERGRIELVNERTEAVFGYPRAELVGREVEILIPERLRVPHRVHRTEYSAAPHARPMGLGLELRGRRSDGSEFPIEVGLSYIRQEGRLTVMAFVTDISARHEAEAALRRHAERLELIRELDQAILVTESATEIASQVLARLPRVVPSRGSLVLEREGQRWRRLTAHGAGGTVLDSELVDRAQLDALRDDETLLVLPLERAGTESGALVIVVDADRPLGEGAREAARSLADLLAVAIQQARLREELRRYATELEQRVRERTREIERRRVAAEGLQDVLSLLNSGRPLDALLATIARQGARLLDASVLAVYRPGSNERATLEAVYAVDAAGALPAMDPEHERLAYLALRGESHSAPTALAEPLIVSGKPYGTLLFRFEGPRELSREDRALAATLAGQVALAIENARLRESVQRTAIEAERSRLARDLHDAVTQTLFSTSLIAEVLPELWRMDPVEGEVKLGDLRELTRGALAEMRTLLFELRPTELTNAPFHDLLRQLADALIGRARLPVTLSLAPVAPLPPDVQVALYRVAQEALNNIARHAGAREVRLKLEDLDPGVRLQIHDDGRGFDPAHAGAGRMGLTGMRERTEAIGATLEIASRPGDGTTVRVVWRPASASEEQDESGR